VRNPVVGSIGGNMVIAARSASKASTGRLPVERTKRVFAFGNHPSSCVLKSVEESKLRPGRNEVSKSPLLRSTGPLNSGSLGGANLIRVANVPAKAAAGTVTIPLPPMADSRSQINVLGTQPRPTMSCHILANRSPACREGSIIAVKNRENPNVMTSTESIAFWP
jgi:hypothetical protein